MGRDLRNPTKNNNRTHTKMQQNQRLEFYLEETAQRGQMFVGLYWENK